MSSKFEREIAKFRQQQQEASKQLEKKEAPKKPKKEPTPAPARHGPSVAYLLRQALKALQAAARPLTPEELRESCGAEDGRWLLPDVLEELKGQDKVRFENGRFSYQARVQARNKEELFDYLSQRPEGTMLKDIRDAYPGDVDGKRMDADVRALAEERRIYALSIAENKEVVLYPREADYDVDVDDRLKRMWQMMEVPSDPQVLVKELRKAKIEPTPRTAMREMRKETKDDRKKKRRRDFSKVHVTNVHLWDELFANAALPMATALD